MLFVDTNSSLKIYENKFSKIEESRFSRLFTFTFMVREPRI